MIKNRILGVLIAMSVTAGAQSFDGARYPIGVSQIALTLAGAGLHVKARQVELETTVWSRSANPAMEIMSAETLPDKKHAWVRIGCREPLDCRSFYATIAWNEPLPPDRNTNHSRVPVHSTSYSPPAMRMGDHATLVVDGPSTHMEIAVIAMQNGAVGQVIRLATPDRKQFFRGQVVNRFTLKGAL